MEGVLTPEIWIAVSEKTQIPELRRTTRDEPVYDKLMKYRLNLLDQHGLKLPDIQRVIGGLRPVARPVEFVGRLGYVIHAVMDLDIFGADAGPRLTQALWRSPLWSQ